MVERLGDEPSYDWLEPSVGEGAFLTELVKTGVGCERITGVDLEPTPHLNDNLAHVIRGHDFVAWSAGSNLRFDRIVANPPYVPLGRIDAELSSAALAVSIDGFPPLTLRSNYWCAFIYASVNLLRVGGALAFVLPSSWEHADYAKELRTLLPKRFARFETYRCMRPLFDSVQEGCVVVVGLGFGESPQCEPVKMEYSNSRDLVCGLRDMCSCPTKTTTNEMTCTLVDDVCTQTRLARDVFDIRLGGVTGEARFFLLSEYRRKGLGLPFESCQPVLSRARHLITSEITPKEWENLRDAGDRVWLFNPSDDVVPEQQVRRYLELDLLSGGCDKGRYKIRNRSPWYRTPMPTTVDAFVSGMSKYGPWMSLNGMRNLSATNTLYIVLFKERLNGDEKAAWALSLLTAQVRRQLTQFARRYPSGLIKFEPGSLLALQLPVPFQFRGAAEYYNSAVNILLQGKVKEATQIADNWFSR